MYSALTGARASQTELAQLCRRWAIALEAGIDIRRLLAREGTAAGRHALGRRLQQISGEVAAGHSLTDAIDRTGEFFPVLFREMLHVGEETGKTAEVFRQLAEHYDHQIKLRRMFLAALTWPAIQLFAAVMIVGLVIWLLGMLPTRAGQEPMDILGFGLVGNRGLVIYFTIVGSVAAVVAGLVFALRRGLFWTAPLQRAILLVPAVGPSLRTLALSRLAWSLHLTLDTGMDLARAFKLSLNSTHNDHFIRHTPQIIEAVTSGHEVTEALAHTRSFPIDFLDAVDTGERSGRLPETLGVLSRQYQEKAQQALGVLTMVAGFMVWALVALLIVLIIVRIFMTAYLGPINEMLDAT